ncbi:hypothetical protein B9Q05_12590 [Candidatus Marsarchaeota G2 archaeon ECH_B_1]|uniref:Uncharacterized protein n=1 Tax=Candidatus Marsarchaeota G2 archaeon ECH_B_1 TaxID=1978159 RepID=A0A2R6BJ76_9ARCH|nr:MAG: hypothetical protein B9Q05_12590 [Candidatus Marsarchaeota G2 archaeon ECH_B_1]
MVIFLLAMAIYSMFIMFKEKAKREELRLLLALVFLYDALENYMVELEGPLISAVKYLLMR